MSIAKTKTSKSPSRHLMSSRYGSNSSAAVVALSMDPDFALGPNTQPQSVHIKIRPNYKNKPIQKTSKNNDYSYSV